MVKELEIELEPENAFNEEKVWKKILSESGIPKKRINFHQLLKRSVDARKRKIVYRLKYKLFIDEEVPFETKKETIRNVADKKAVHIIGAGPAGLFAALELIKNGRKPIIFERGKDVRSRRRDLAAINKEHLVNPESNYCFGEGGAGTYSDGKLYTRSKKRGDVQKILDILIDHGAPENIRIDAHPHIGTNKLPKIITSIREKILTCGGEFHFNSKLTDIKLNGDSITAIEINDENWLQVQELILATGHSARDIFELLQRKNIKIEAKSFALGVRVEHPQALIDKIQYHTNDRSDLLPPASYTIVEQVDGKGVYSFCMCPGGIIAPCATKAEEIVTNGWSPSKRNNPFANSGIVVSIDENDWKGFSHKGALAALYFQADIEKKAFKAVNREKQNQFAPAQRLLDFVEGKDSKDLPACSYLPGVVPARVDLIFPQEISSRLKKAFRAFGKKMKDYLSNEAIVVAVESRTSSPVRIPRDKQNYQHIEIKNFYPCGEGAGYAGGIVSAAIDGINCATAIKINPAF